MSETETKLRQQILMLSIQNAMLVNNINTVVNEVKHIKSSYAASMETLEAYSKETNAHIVELAKKIPKQHEVEKWVADANESERQQTQDMRDAARHHLKVFNETVSRFNDGEH